MTFEEQQILSAKLAIAENQTRLEAYQLEKKAEKFWHEAFLARERVCLLADANYQLFHGCDLEKEE